MGLYSEIQKAAGKGQKKFAVLIDPDKHTPASLKKIKTLSISGGADLFFFGGSLLTKDVLKKDSPLPVLLFPGNNLQINSKADGILLLSLISGRNPELLIGRHVVAAPYIKASGLEVIPTGYILVDGGSATAVSYMSSTTPIPADKPGIAACTAMAGEMLGLGMIYMDAGSGAKNPVTVEMIREVRRSTSIPLVVGGGITTAVKARKAASAGADIVVVGNALEKDPGLVSKISKAIHQ
jgi:geranylgeranylglyceryl phosphate synthase family protein